jgi:hypothetical protein
VAVRHLENAAVGQRRRPRASQNCELLQKEKDVDK